MNTKTAGLFASLVLGALGAGPLAMAQESPMGHSLAMPGASLVYHADGSGPDIRVVMAFWNKETSDIYVSSDFRTQLWHSLLTFFDPDGGVHRTNDPDVAGPQPEPGKGSRCMNASGEKVNCKRVDILPPQWQLIAQVPEAGTDPENDDRYYFPELDGSLGDPSLTGTWRVESYVPLRVFKPEAYLQYKGVDFAWDVPNNVLYEGGLMQSVSFTMAGDYDGDGYPYPVVPEGWDEALAQVDCDDRNAEVHPGAMEVPGDGLDNDCDPDTKDKGIPPFFKNLEGPTEPVDINNQPVSVTATFLHPAEITANFEWGDGGTSTVTGAVSTATENHSYSAAGVYTVEATLSDGPASTTQQYEYIVIYDPSGGFVTGGGWIWSEEGWCSLDDVCGGAEGKANFGFNSKYEKGASTPDGSTNFNFRVGGLHFHSDTYEWLVVTGNNYAKYKGTGTINGQSTPTGDDYKFMLWAGDGDHKEPAEPDTFRIKIWKGDEESGEEMVVYDNGSDHDQEIDGGSIVVHTGK